MKPITPEPKVVPEKTTVTQVALKRRGENSVMDAIVTARAPDMPMPAMKRHATRGTNDRHAPHKMPNTPNRMVAAMIAWRRPTRSEIAPKNDGPINPAIRLELNRGPSAARLRFQSFTKPGAAKPAADMLYPSAKVTSVHNATIQKIAGPRG